MGRTGGGGPWESKGPKQTGNHPLTKKIDLSQPWDRWVVLNGWGLPRHLVSWSHSMESWPEKPALGTSSCLSLWGGDGEEEGEARK
jgi:hypothetical protein